MAPACIEACHRTKLCQCWTKVGLSFVSEKRNVFIPVVFALVLTSLLFFITGALVALSTDTDVIKNVHWQHSTLPDGTKIYLAINGYALDLSTAGTTGKVNTVDFVAGDGTWAHLDCESELCEACSEAATELMILAIIGTFAKLPQLIYAMRRKKVETDAGIFKFLACFFGTLGCLIGCLDVSMFGMSCVSKMPSDAQAGLGPGSCLIITALCLDFIVLSIHVLMPVPLELGEIQKFSEDGTKAAESNTEVEESKNDP
eukprot:TRINITY_DN64809_c0_g1_i1.p1 TRINITY_DN64809_c0_g1~~TRINITY_DN64809_c0_g1_i1.p1  ORF type:complete len:274 (-),score=46.26 TRINITY_DN64809_c0_g1_i1:89-862(-)